MRVHAARSLRLPAVPGRRYALFSEREPAANPPAAADNPILMQDDLLELRDLSIRFESAGQINPVVHDLSLRLARGKSLAIVGESGSGKSVTALALTRLLPSNARLAGDILFDGRSTLRASEGELRRIRGRQIAYVFQEPATSLNPVFSVYEQLAETIRVHRPDVSDVKGEIIYWLDQVGIANSAKRARDYPFQLSGGMQQRVMIAMALCGRPKILVADEPTTALDVTIQKQIMDLFGELKQKFAMSLLLITHNFGIIRGIADEVAVMFRGRLVETGSAESVLRAPGHPYTKALIECVPRLGAHSRRLKTIDYSSMPIRD